MESQEGVFMAIKEGGINGLWEYLKDEFQDLKETIIDNIKTMVMEQVLQAGVKWILSCSIPSPLFSRPSKPLSTL
jgi:hypothetical protein